MHKCRFCKQWLLYDGATNGIMYALRSWAHYDCYLKAKKPLRDLRLWQLKQFPAAVLAVYDKTDEVTQLIAEKEKRREAWR